MESRRRKFGSFFWSEPSKVSGGRTLTERPAPRSSRSSGLMERRGTGGGLVGGLVGGSSGSLPGSAGGGGLVTVGMFLRERTGLGRGGCKGGASGAWEAERVVGIHSKEAYPRSRSTKLLSRSVSGVTKVRYGDRPDFRTLEWGVPVCKVASIQIGRGFNLCVAPF